jgi:hypothetical protein
MASDYLFDIFKFFLIIFLESQETIVDISDRFNRTEREKEREFVKFQEISIDRNYLYTST